jgi:hypothetical protein
MRPLFQSIFACTGIYSHSQKVVSLRNVVRYDRTGTYGAESWRAAMTDVGSEVTVHSHCLADETSIALVAPSMLISIDVKIKEILQ